MNIPNTCLTSRTSKGAKITVDKLKYKISEKRCSTKPSSHDW